MCAFSEIEHGSLSDLPCRLAQSQNVRCCHLQRVLTLSSETALRFSVQGEDRSARHAVFIIFNGAHPMTRNLSVPLQDNAINLNQPLQGSLKTFIMMPLNFLCVVFWGNYKTKALACLRQFLTKKRLQNPDAFSLVQNMLWRSMTKLFQIQEWSFRYLRELGHTANSHHF